MGEIFLPVIVVALVSTIGFRQLTDEPPAPRTLRVDLIQPSIPQTLIWDTSRDQERFHELIHLSEQALSNRTDLLVWPEAAVPSYARWDTNVYPAITNLVRRHHVWLVLGSDDLARARRTTTGGWLRVYNASFLVNPDGEFVARYRKRNLVIFGEYIPLVRWLPFVKWFTPIEGGFTPGHRRFPSSLRHPDVKTSVLICFEDIFPHLAREIRRRRHRFPDQPHQRRLVRRERGPMAASRRRPLPRGRKRPAAHPLLEQRPDRLGGLPRPPARGVSGRPRHHLWPGLPDR